MLLLPVRTSGDLSAVDNEGYAVSLEKRKIISRFVMPLSEKHGLLRIVDESGEDYLYPKKFFRPIALPPAVKRAVLAAEEPPPPRTMLEADLTAHTFAKPA